MHTFKLLMPILVGLLFSLAACDDITLDLDTSSGANVPAGEQARVVRVIDGDTIDVLLDGEEVRVRYIGIDTPEREDPCYSEATQANRALVNGQTVTLVRDVSETDRFGRLLRYIYVGDVFVNERLIAEGWARAVSFSPDTTHYLDFLQLQRQASNQDLGCHPTGVFN